MAALIKENGKVSESIEYVAKQKGHWIAVPATVGSPTLPPCARIDLFKEHVGLDLTKMYPAGAPPDKELADNWTWDAFLSAAEKCFKAGYPFGMPLGTTNDAVNWVEVVLRGHGAQLVDQEGNITVNSDATKQVLEWFKRLVPMLPRDVFAWDDSSATTNALISGMGALIMNPPSAWAVAVRDAPQIAEKCWTFPTPKGPKGRFDAAVPFFWGIWKFSPNKPAAKSLLAYLVPALFGRADRRREQGLRHPALCQSARLQDLGRRGAAQGHDLQLSAARRRHHVGRLQPGTGAHRQPDLCAGDGDQDDRAMHTRRQIDRPGDRLGRLGARGLQPQLARSEAP